MKIKSSLALLLVSALLTSGCGNTRYPEGQAPAASSDAVLGTVIAAPGYAPVTVIPQFIPTTDGAVAPGMANYWDLASNFSIDDGSDDQFDTFLELTVGGTPFPSDQTQSELTFYTPVMGSADGIKTVDVSGDTTTWYNPLAGTYSAYLYPTGNSILQQSVNLTTAVGAITLNYSVDGSSRPVNISGGPDTFRIVVRNTSGAELSVISTNAFGTRTADLSAFRGQSIVLSFEHKAQYYPIVIDDVSITDGATTEFVANGDFESGVLSPWTANSAAEFVQNITSGTRTLEGLQVTRSFYTVPNKLWGRWVDVFSNPTASAIPTTISYYNELGSDGSGIIYYTPGTNNKAITTWDGDASDRDVGFVFGNATTVSFTSEDGFGNNNGSDLIPTTYTITVPAGRKVAIVNFVILSGIDTGNKPGVLITDKATEVDTAAAAIVNNFWTDPQYRNGMTQEQISAIVNF